MSLADTPLTHQFLIAMPELADGIFHRAVIYLFRSDKDGSAGIIINQPSELLFGDLLTDLRLPPLKPLRRPEQPVLVGGPVHPELGFVLHRGHGPWTSTMHSAANIAVTHSRDVLDAISQGHGPADYLVSLGYAGWEAGQLEQELADNLWLTLPANESVMFDLPYDERWEAAIKHIGFDWHLLSHEVGHA
ncbi:MAG: YqgE/AlgH family protein [Pseudomonadota bacterium]